MGNMFVYVSLAGAGTIALLIPSLSDVPAMASLTGTLSNLTQTCWPHSGQIILVLGAIGVMLSFLLLLPATLWARRRIGLKRSRRLLTALPLALTTVAILCATAAQLSIAQANALHCDGRLTRAAFTSHTAEVWTLWMLTSSRFAAATIIATAGLMIFYPRKWKRYG